ncbi:AtzH-like domain-containing protein [Planctomonas psychrotolerans]|uniref:AtzH-like domain-containing protein n=1 Tax=Planctomonas psychrotolerans TaxID=2528712 RepID=UPI001D0D0164|nr:AtzH-like domain-containing protein [Planctomonas psychrotolerans]
MADNAGVRVGLPEGEEIPDGLLDAFWRYERALMANDLTALDALFAPGASTLRGDATGVLVGHDTIGEFRRARGGSPARTLHAVEVRPAGDDFALIVAVTAPMTGGRGQQTQLWHRGPSGWVVQAAHVSLPAPAIASATWRIVGTPLVSGSSAPAQDGAAGPASAVPASAVPASAAPAGTGASAGLAGHGVAVKDLFAVAGHPIGAGVPQYLAEAHAQPRHADAVAALLDAGADVLGIARTDEFAYSIAGRNPHYGTPPNAAVPGAIPGGSSSGPAAAVAAGQASIGLATDTGGSIRVPASYTGLWGIRTTHGAVSTDGMVPLAPSFDTVGWLTRDPATLAAAARASMDAQHQRSVPATFVLAPDLLTRVDAAVRDVFVGTISRLVAEGLMAAPESVDLGNIDALFETFRVVQAAEAWRSHGAWISAHPGVLGPDVAGRFDAARSLTSDEVSAARADRLRAQRHLDAVLGDRVLLMPAASSAAPSTTADAATIDRTRGATLRLTCIAGLTGRPGLSIPGMTVPAATTRVAPVGLGLVGPRYGDLALIDLGTRLAARIAAPHSA